MIRLGISILLIVVFCTFHTRAQDYIYKPEHRFSGNELVEDFRIFTESLEATHPALFMHHSKETYEKRKLQIMEVLGDGMSEDDFHLLLRKFIHPIGCGHTTVLPSDSWYAHQRKHAKLLPFTIFIHDHKFYLDRVFTDDSIAQRGCELLAINGNRTEEMLTQMISIQQHDGISSSFYEFKVQQLFRTYYLFLYGSNEVYSIEIKDNKGNHHHIELKGGIKPGKEVPDEKTDHFIEVSRKWARYYIPEKSSRFAVLDIDAFSSKKFRKYYKEVFKLSEKHQVQNLIVDLRDNTGGYFPNGNNLLRYLLPETFFMDFWHPDRENPNNPHISLKLGSKMTVKLMSMMPDKDKSDPKRNYHLKYKPKRKHHFDGEIIVLINGGSFSLSSYTAAKLDELTDATFIGQETGGNKSGSNAIITYNLELPNTRIRGVLPYYRIDHKCSRYEKGRGVFPTVTPNYTLDDVLKHRDRDMDAAIDYINSK